MDKSLALSLYGLFVILLESLLVITLYFDNNIVFNSFSFSYHSLALLSHIVSSIKLLDVSNSINFKYLLLEVSIYLFFLSIHKCKVLSYYKEFI